MPVKISNEPKCGVCGREKGALNRWFLTRINEDGFCFRAYGREFLGQYDEAICGMECLDKGYHAYACGLMGMK